MITNLLVVILVCVFIWIDIDALMQYRAVTRRLKKMYPSVEEINKDWTVLAQTDTEKLWLKVAHKAFLLFRRKNKDYGNVNTVAGLPGIVIRLVDKVARIFNIMKHKELQVKDETVTDTLIDMVNYSIMGASMSVGEWPIAKIEDVLIVDKTD